MREKEFLEYCLEKKGAYLDFPFGMDVAVVKVGKRIFAQMFELKKIPTITLNYTYDLGLYYRNTYPDIVTRGYHCPPVQQPYFNSMPLYKLSDQIIKEMIDHSYDTVFNKLPKYVQAEIKYDVLKINRL